MRLRMIGLSPRVGVSGNVVVVCLAGIYLKTERKTKISCMVNMTTFDYTFNRQIQDLSQLDSYMQALEPSLINIVYFPESFNMTMSFPQQLTAQDQARIQQELTAYSDPPPVLPYSLKCAGLQPVNTSSTVWTTIMTSAYQGQLNPTLGVLVELRLRSYLKPSVENDSGSANFYYDVQIIDDSNNVIASGRFNNTMVQDNSLPVAAASVNPAAHSLQIRKGSAGAAVYLAAYCGVYTYP